MTVNPLKILQLAMLIGELHDAGLDVQKVVADVKAKGENFGLKDARIAVTRSQSAIDRARNA